MQRRKELGSGILLIELLICLTIAGILLAAIPAPVIKLQQNKTESAAASALATVNFAEYSYMRAYGGFIGGGTQPLLPLSGVLNSTAQPCANPMMLPAQIANLPAANFQGYTMTFTGNGAAANFTCPGGPTTAYTGYSINLDPADLLAAKRHLFTCTGYASCDGLVHFNDAQPAAQIDPIFNTAVIGDAGANSGSTGNNGPSGASTFAGNWTSSGSYGQGNEVTLSSQTYAGYTTTATGPFFNVTGANGGWPPGDTKDWLYCCGTASYAPTVTPCGGTYSGTVQILTLPLSQNYVPQVGLFSQLIGPSAGCGSYSHIAIQAVAGVPLGPGGVNLGNGDSGEITIGIWDVNSSTGVWGCQMGSGAPITLGSNSYTGCMSPGGSPWDASMAVQVGDTLLFLVTGPAGATATYQMQVVTYTLSP